LRVGGFDSTWFPVDVRSRPSCRRSIADKDRHAHFRQSASMSESSSFLPTTAALMPLPEASDALPVGTRLGEFEIREVIGVGGFGIVYRAWEPALEREVALKEYMPMGMVGRGADGRVTLRSRVYEEDYALGLRSFVNEARLLARFDHPSLVKVHRFWEANGTAYMAMPFYKAQTLRQRRQDIGAQPPTQAWLMSMIEPLLGALAEMHRADVYHRDIAPDNILWCADNRPVLLDFGAARHVLTDRTQTLTAILKPQFAPIEQYADAQSMRQGPWTDVFALASTCYFMLTGRPPLPATARILSDDLTPLAQLAPPGFSAHVLATLDWAMSVRPQDRPQSVAILWDALHGHVQVPPRAVGIPPAPARPAIAATDFAKTIQTFSGVKDRSKAGTLDGSGLRAMTRGSTAQAARAESVKLRALLQSLKPDRWLLLVLAVVAAGAYAWLGQGHDTREPAEAAAIPSPPVASAPALGTPASAPWASASAAPSNSASMPGEKLHAKGSQESSTWAAAHEASGSASSAMPHSRTAPPAFANRSPGPRETCAASKSSSVDECVRRVCKSEPRFKRLETCVRLQRQADPWWRIFKPG
jgi:serine/threonine protein kinase